MGKGNNIGRIGDILLRPRSFFADIASGLPDTRNFMFSYGVPLMTLGAAGRMVRVMNQLILDGMTPRGDRLAGLFMLTLVAYFVAVWFGGSMLNRLAKAFGGVPGKEGAVVFCISVLTPFMLAQALAALHPSLAFFSVAGLVYTLVLIAKGSGPLFRIPPPRILGFTMVGFFILFGIAYVIILVFSALFIFDPA